VIVALAALAMIASGCGTTKVIPSGGQLTVALTEYRLRPQRVEVTSGSLTIVAHNYGRLTHNVVILQDGRAQDSMQPIPPGGSGELTVYLLPGRYILASTVQSDQALGVYGSLIVRPG
jgi:hypothetical protein